MPKMNVDEQEQIAEPIEIIIDGKLYVVTKISEVVLKKVDEIGKLKEIDSPAKQLAVFVGVDAKEFEGVDLRKIGKALVFITKTIEDGIGAPKNS